MKWIRITEKKPELGDHVLICYDSGSIRLVYYTSRGFTECSDGLGHGFITPSYWMKVEKP